MYYQLSHIHIIYIYIHTHTITYIHNNNYLTRPACVAFVARLVGAREAFSFSASLRLSGPRDRWIQKKLLGENMKKTWFSMVIHDHHTLYISSTGGSEGIDLRAAGFLGTAKLRRYVWRPADIGLLWIIHGDSLRLQMITGSHRLLSLQVHRQCSPERLVWRSKKADRNWRRDLGVCAAEQHGCSLRRACSEVDPKISKVNMLHIFAVCLTI